MQDHIPFTKTSVQKTMQSYVHWDSIVEIDPFSAGHPEGMDADCSVWIVISRTDSA